MFDVATIQINGQIRQAHAQRDKPAHRFEKPTQKNGNTATHPQNRHFVDVHVQTGLGLGNKRTDCNQQRERPVEKVKVSDK